VPPGPPRALPSASDVPRRPSSEALPLQPRIPFTSIKKIATYVFPNRTRGFSRGASHGPFFWCRRSRTVCEPNRERRPHTESQKVQPPIRALVAAPSQLTKCRAPPLSTPGSRRSHTFRRWTRIHASLAAIRNRSPRSLVPRPATNGCAEKKKDGASLNGRPSAWWRPRWALALLVGHRDPRDHPHPALLHKKRGDRRPPLAVDGVPTSSPPSAHCRTCRSSGKNSAPTRDPCPPLAGRGKAPRRDPPNTRLPPAAEPKPPSRPPSLPHASSSSEAPSDLPPDKTSLFFSAHRKSRTAC